jgi:ATP-dependent DNA helicase RecG
MKSVDVIARIGLGEDSRTRFLPNVTDEETLAQELVSLANGLGGCVYLGVDEKGRVIGLPDRNRAKARRVVHACAERHVRPAISVEIDNVEVTGRLLEVVSIREGTEKPYSDSRGRFWFKCATTNREIPSQAEAARLVRPAGYAHGDSVPVEGTTTSDLDMEHLDEFFKKQYGEALDATLDRDGISVVQLLHNLGLARDANLNLAGLLLFSRNPQRHRPAFFVKAVSFVGNDPTGDRCRDSEDIVGCLRDMHKKTMSFLTRNLRRLQGEKGFNTEGDLEVPVSALEELVVNMLLHRDYFISAPWRVMIFDSRVELISPGALPNNLTVENIRNGVSNMRNPLIASFATKELPYRGIGTGIRRALAAVPALKLESDHERNLFTARVPRKAA